MTSEDDLTERAESEALAWFVRLNEPRATEQVRRDFARWLAADPAHREAYGELSTLWKDLEAPAVALSAGGAHRRAESRSTLNWRGRSAALAIAATVVTAAILWLDPGIIDRVRADHATRPGERLEVALADGTSLLLDGDSAVTADIGAARREVAILRGRVWFDVAHDALRPFAVRADGIDVRVLGTAFAVDRDRGQITVERGSVSVTRADDHFRLGAGQQVDRAGDGLASPRGVDPAASLAWRRGLIVLDAARLDDVFAELGRMAGDRVIAPQAEVRAMRLSGSFRADEPEALFEAMRSGLGLRVIAAGRYAALVYR